jgi:hypothetical protein
MSINRSNPYALTGMVALKGDEQGLAYFKRLTQQDLRLMEGYVHTVNLMAAGEYPLTIFMQVSKLDLMKRKEAPVDWLRSRPLWQLSRRWRWSKMRSTPRRRSC